MRHDGTAGPRLSVVIPLFDEAVIVGELVDRLRATLDRMGLADAEVILVDDGSHDGTWAEIRRAYSRDRRFVGLSLSRNFGHQAALSAGLSQARGAAVVLMDGDLQDPPEAIPLLWDRLRDGYDVVYAIRSSRPEGLGKRVAYGAFYRLLESNGSIPIPRHAGDFGIMSRRVVDLIVALPERRRFVRGLRAWVGFRQVGVPIPRAPRRAGSPKFTLRKLLGLALDGLVGFGDSPLRWAAPFGLGLMVAAPVGFLIWEVWEKNSSSTGAGLLAALGFFGGAQLLCAAILGEYASRIFQEISGRPSYVIGRRLDRGRRPDASRPRGSRRGIVPRPDEGEEDAATTRSPDLLAPAERS